MSDDDEIEIKSLGNNLCITNRVFANDAARAFRTAILHKEPLTAIAILRFIVAYGFAPTDSICRNAAVNLIVSRKKASFRTECGAACIYLCWKTSNDKSAFIGAILAAASRPPLRPRRNAKTQVSSRQATIKDILFGLNKLVKPIASHKDANWIILEVDDREEFKRSLVVHELTAS